MIGYHVSHEQFPPSELLHLVMAAEDNGFEAALSSDHFYPWSDRQGHSGYAWSWLGSAMQATSFPFGIVNAPGQRYNPAIIAQACATLSEMYPGRFWIALGSGQYLNEAITGEGWPPKASRNARLEICANIIRDLLHGKTVTDYDFFPVENARLYTLPAEPPKLFAAAITPETARWAGSWADGLITVSQPRDRLAGMIQAFRQGGGEGKPLYLKVQVSYAGSDEDAYASAWEQWRTNVFASNLLTDLRFPEQFEEASRYIERKDMDTGVLISADTDRYIEWISSFQDMGFERIYLHNVNRMQTEFITAFGKKVLPAVSRKVAV
jgi:probable non-F420 flavinoid oxidoreductase